MNIKVIKKLTVLLAVSGILLTSCNNNNNKNTTKYNENIVVLDLKDGKKAVVSKDYYGTHSFRNWNSFNVANTDIHEAENLEYKTSTTRIDNLNKPINNLSNTIPSWLETEEIMEDIEDVQEEYQTLLDEKYQSTQEVRENWEELTEKFDDLREELDETINEYAA